MDADPTRPVARVVYSRLVSGGYGGRDKTMISIDINGLVCLARPGEADCLRQLTAEELASVASVCDSEAVANLDKKIELPRIRSGGTSISFTLGNHSVTTNDLESAGKAAPSALRLIGRLFDALVSWSQK